MAGEEWRRIRSQEGNRKEPKNASSSWSSAPSEKQRDGHPRQLRHPQVHVCTYMYVLYIHVVRSQVHPPRPSCITSGYLTSHSINSALLLTSWQLTVHTHPIHPPLSPTADKDRGAPVISLSRSINCLPACFPPPDPRLRLLFQVHERKKINKKYHPITGKIHSQRP